MREEVKSNTRAFRRVRAKIPVALLVGRERGKTPNMASIVQTSFLGARVRTDTPLKAGQAVQVVRLTGSCGDVPTRVVWVGKRGSSHEGQAGLEFLNPLNARITT